MPAVGDLAGAGGALVDALPADVRAVSGDRLHARREGQAYFGHSEVYVDAILSYARRMIIEPHDFFVYYSWQVYVMTRRGPVRITGPGL